MSNTYESILSNINRWQHLKNDDDNDMFQKHVIDNSIDFVSNILQLFNISVPEEYFADDGEIGFTWENEDVKIQLENGNYSYNFTSVSFLSDNHVVVYCRMNGYETLTADVLYSKWDYEELVKRLMTI